MVYAHYLLFIHNLLIWQTLLCAAFFKWVNAFPGNQAHDFDSFIDISVTDVHLLFVCN